MSDRASGHPGSARRGDAGCLLVPSSASSQVLAGPLALAAAATNQPTRSRRRSPRSSRSRAATASFKLTIDVTVDARWASRPRTSPAGLDRALPGRRPSSSTARTSRPGDSAEVTLDVEIPEDTTATPASAVVASRRRRRGPLPLTIRVADAAAGEVTLTSRLPELQAAAGSTFTFNVTLHNDTTAGTTFTLDATGPAGWTVSAKPRGQAQGAASP